MLFMFPAKPRAIGDFSGRFRKRIVAKIKAKLAVVAPCTTAFIDYDLLACRSHAQAHNVRDLLRRIGNTYIHMYIQVPSDSLYLEAYS
jgi:hypothetical protein